jgi:hypothetical protein
VQRVHLSARFVRLALVVGLLLSVQPPAMSGAEETVPVPATSLTLEATGGSVAVPAVISGSLADELGNPIGSAPIVLESRTDTATAWTAVEPTLTTDADGGFATTQPIRRNTYFRASYESTAGAPAAAAGATATFTPTISWSGPATYVSPNVDLTFRASVSVPSHPGCSGTFRIIEWGLERTVERRKVTVAGVFDPKTGTMRFSLTTKVREAGTWQVDFDLAADAVHAGAGTGSYHSVGRTLLTMSVDDSTVKVRAPVTVTGYLKDSANHHGVSGQWVRVERQLDGHWARIGAAKTGRGGKLTFVMHPRSVASYRLVYPGGSTWSSNASHSTLVRTVFTLSGTRSHHFTDRKVWLTIGWHDMQHSDFSMVGVQLHSKDESFSEQLFPPLYPFGGGIKVPMSGYYHLRTKVPRGFAPRPYKVKLWT